MSAKIYNVIIPIKAVKFDKKTYDLDILSKALEKSLKTTLVFPLLS